VTCVLLDDFCLFALQHFGFHLYKIFPRSQVWVGVVPAEFLPIGFSPRSVDGHYDSIAQRIRHCKRISAIFPHEIRRNS
jgi:hypothetical protein